MSSTANFPTYKTLTSSLFNCLDKISRNAVSCIIQDTYTFTLQFLGQDIKKYGLLPISPHTRNLRPHSSTSWTRYQEMWSTAISPHTRNLRPHSSISWTRYQEMWSTANFLIYKILTPSLFNFLDKISRNVVYCQFPQIQDTPSPFNFLDKI